jgi:hypothetical protein
MAITRWSHVEAAVTYEASGWKLTMLTNSRNAFIFDNTGKFITHLVISPNESPSLLLEELFVVGTYLSPCGDGHG